MHFLNLSGDIAARMNLIGSYLLQLLIAGLLGSLFVIRASWDRIKTFFRRLFSRRDDDSSDEE